MPNTVGHFSHVRTVDTRIANSVINFQMANSNSHVRTANSVSPFQMAVGHIRTTNSVGNFQLAKVLSHIRSANSVGNFQMAVSATLKWPTVSAILKSLTVLGIFEWLC
jgi:hypothetical protein